MAASTSSGRPIAVTQALAAHAWDQVVSICRETLNSAPATDWAACDLSRAFFAQGQEANARDVLASNLPTLGRESECAGRLREWLVADASFDKLAEVLPEVPTNADSVQDRILAAVYAQRRGDVAGAAAACQSLLARRPEHPEALNHLGRALHNLGRHGDALACFRKATELNPLNPESWHNLAFSLRAAGRLDDSVLAYRKALELRPCYRSAAVNLGKTLLALDSPAQALPVLRDWIAREPQDVEAIVHEGLCLHLLGELDAGIASYRRALAVDPKHGLAWLYLGVLLSESADSAGAGDALSRATQLLPQDADAWAALAAWHEVENHLEPMADALRRGNAANPAHPGLAIETARYQRRTQRPDAAVNKLLSVSPQQLPARQRVSYWFELGRSLDRLDRVDEAWHAFSEGNRLGREMLSLRPANVELLPELLHRLNAWSPMNASSWHDSSGQAPPVFLLGFPRSGITLLSTMLACHDAIACIDEKPTIEACVQWLATRPGGYPEAIDRLTDDEVEHLRGLYWRQARSFLPSSTRPVLVDMFPFRTLHLAVVGRLFPGAKVLFMERHPADVVLSNFMQEYAINAANAHFFAIESAAKTYADTMEFWQRAKGVFPINAQSVRYEALIANPDRTLHQLLDGLGLPWQDGVLHDHAQRAREVRTSTCSYHEIAEPLYDRSVNRWQRYRHKLQPVLGTLAPAADRFGYRL